MRWRRIRRNRTISRIPTFASELKVFNKPDIRCDKSEHKITSANFCCVDYNTKMTKNAPTWNPVTWLLILKFILPQAQYVSSTIAELSFIYFSTVASIFIMNFTRTKWMRYGRVYKQRSSVNTYVDQNECHDNNPKRCMSHTFMSLQ